MSEKRDNHCEGNEVFLQEIGKRVRGLRASRGMTRKMLAHDSSVSERYLADFEQGKGNISINLLRQVAQALRTDLSELLPFSEKQTPELSLITEFVSHLTREEQQTALQSLYQQFSSLNHVQSRIAFIGLRGAGKTTLGKLLQERQAIPFIKLVQKVETIGGMPIAELLELSGQTGYRRLEEKALFTALSEHESCCIETGGSIVAELKNLNILLSTCLVIWVRTTPKEHMERVINQDDLRPMEDNNDAMADLERILEERTPYYEKAHAILNTSAKTVEQSYKELIQIIQKYEAIKQSPDR